MIVAFFTINIVFVMVDLVNFFLAPLYFQIEFFLPLLIFFLSIYKDWKFFAVVFFAFLPNLFIQKNWFFFLIYSGAVAYILFKVKSFINIFSIYFLFFMSFLYLIMQHFILMWLVSNKPLLTRYFVMNEIIYIVGNTILAPLVYEISKKIYFFLRDNCEKVICCS